MSEICLDYRNEMNDANEPAGKYILTKELELCEHCEELKRVIVIERSQSV